MGELMAKKKKKKAAGAFAGKRGAAAVREKKKINTKRILPITLCIILGILLVAGIVLGTIAIVREVSSVVSYEGVRIEKGVACYLASTYKASYKGEDAELEDEIERYIRRIAVAAYLFDRTAELGETGEAWIERNVNEVVEYKAEGSVSKFNELAEPMGFDFSDFKKGTELIYKAVSALNAIYGVNGAKLSYSNNAALAEEYFSEYTHVKILYLRTEDKFAIDEDGNRVPNGDGTDMTVALTPEERAAVAEDIAEITQLIENAKNGVGTEMSLQTFNSYYDKYNDEPAYAESGYYLHPDSDFTAYLRGEGGYPNLVSTALSMEIGEWGKSTDGSVTCFIYKYAPLSPDYAATDLQRFFGDFYANAAEHLFMESVDELAEDVRVKDKYHELNVADLPKNTLFKVVGLGIGLSW